MTKDTLSNRKEHLKNETFTSVRVAETASKRDATHTFEQLTELAAGLGYEAVCMRASQVGIHSPLEQITAARKQAESLNLKVSMITGDFPVHSTTIRARTVSVTSRRISI